MSGWIDSHMHVWQLARGDYDWLTPDLSDLYRDFLIEDGIQAAGNAGIERFILVQAAATRAETDYIIRVARGQDRVASVVGWIDFEAPDAIDQIYELAEEPLVCGIRPMIADMDDPDWLLKSQFAPIFETLAATRLVFDGHAREDLIRRKCILADRHPDLTIVLNHAGKPQIHSGDLSGWKSELLELAQRPNVFCKFSGLLTEASPGATVEDLKPVTDLMFNSFGVDRLVWGSDWPVLNMASDYQNWLSMSQQITAGLSASERDALFGKNAFEIYQLGERT